VRFVLEVDLPDDPADGDAAFELSRILRYWAGGVRQLELRPGMGTDAYDSAYRKVGAWRITADPEAEPPLSG
jgi:hypothetical protein